MTKVVDVQEAQANFSALLEQAHSGQEIILEKGGKPYARLIPVPSGESSRKPGRLKGKVGDEFFESLPEEELAAWEGR